MGVKITVNPEIFDLKIDVEPHLKKAAEIAKDEMAHTPGLPTKKVNYKGSFYTRKTTKKGNPVYYVKNKESWMDSFLNNGHVVHNAKNKKYVEGLFYFQKGEQKAEKYIDGVVFDFKKK